MWVYAADQTKARAPGGINAMGLNRDGIAYSPPAKAGGDIFVMVLPHCPGKFVQAAHVGSAAMGEAQANLDQGYRPLH